MIHFKSITTRIISLHVIAIGITSILMPLALYWLLSSTANDLHHRALREYADTIAQYLSPRPEGGWRLDLPGAARALLRELRPLWLRRARRGGRRPFLLAR